MRAILPFLLGLAGVGMAADWPQYRGPNGDGSTLETLRTDWDARPPEVIWRRPIGPGFSSMVVHGERVWTQERRTVAGAEREFCVCLDVETGVECWATEVGRASYTDLSGFDERMDGPRTTPTIDGDRVYVLTSHLKLYCLRADNGEEVWQRDFRTELGSPIIPWQNCASPLVVGDLIFLNSNAADRSLMAVNKADGTTAWSGENDSLTHSTPILAEIGGTSQVIFLTLSGLVAVVPESGSILWRLSFSPSGTSTAASPVVVGEYVHASATYASGSTWIARVEREGDGFTAVEAYRRRGTAYQIHWASPVHHQGFVYAVASPSPSQARLVCLDIAAGENRWEQMVVGGENIGYGSLIKAADKLVVLTEAGTLVLVEPNPTSYEELATFEALDRYCWNYPVLAGGRIFARSTSPTNPEIVALDVAVGLGPLPPLGLAVHSMAAGDSFLLTVEALDGSELGIGEAERIELISTTDLSTPLAEWTILADVFSVASGNLRVEIPFGTDRSRYLLVREVAKNN